MTQTATDTNRRILIIDDNQQIHRDFTKILRTAATAPKGLEDIEAQLFGRAAARRPQEMNFDLAYANQGHEGLQMVRESLAAERPYALAFVDMRMPPGWDGLETIARIWQLDPHLQTVICTAFSDHSWNQVVERLGRTDKLLILKKPFDVVEVLQLAHALTDKWSTARLLSNHLQDLERAVDERTHEAVSANQELQRSMLTLKAMSMRIEKILKVLPMVLLEITGDDRISHCNATIKQLFGLDEESTLGEPIATLPVSWDREQVAGLLRLVRTTDQAQELEAAYRRSDGSDGILLMSAVRLPGDGNNVLLICSDVTQRKMMEIELIQSQKLTAIGRLASGIAHEINTPLQYIGDNLRFLEDSITELTALFADYQRTVEAARAGGGSEPAGDDADRRRAAENLTFLVSEVPKAIQQSTAGVQQVSRIVTSMREFSHQGSDQLVAIDLNAALASTLEISRGEYRQVAEVVLACDPQLPLVTCVPGKINQVFLNLILNASQALRGARAGGARGTITITTRVAEIPGWVEVRIHDTGPGIPERIKPRLFEPFFTTRPVGAGTGQGLFLSREIVKGHGGSLTFESAPGAGTVFIISLPIRALRKQAAEGDQG